jgi:GntR family transcriptional regulator, arabinose operon transcriptional repressor
VPKYKLILEELRTGILLGRYREGDRLPSEMEIGRQFNVSRLTVQRSLKELQIEGLVDRRAGSGTYVATRKQTQGHLLGLLIPGLGNTEIFEPVCRGMAKAGRTGGHALLWSGDAMPGTESQAAQARQLCLDYVERGVSGVFFAPLEFIPDRDSVNEAIAETIAKAGIPLVLLDRCFRPYPHRSRFDLVGIDNRRAGYRITEHMIGAGAQRPAFFAHPGSASTVDARIAGFRDAAAALGTCPAHVFVRDTADPQTVRCLLDQFNPDAFICANDGTAAELMATLESLAVPVPQQVRVAGIDDARYASHLRVPLTTLRQPCEALGEMAIQVMLSRICQPELPARDVLLDCSLVIRQSCGAALRQNNHT